ncbi:hypothetical protein [Shewanella sp.]|uniref:hypothetical protein n=1 Tax=Shewanella sp. TaxID=50422 RepID=UPI003D0CF32B
MTTHIPKPQPLDQSPPEDTQKSFKWLIICLAIIAACLLALYFMNFHNGWGDKGDFGTFGDFFGGVLNPILGFATVGLLVWSLKMQMSELALSRQELALTRKELKETKEEAARSSKAAQDQVEHFQREAKLNELTRLLGELKLQIDKKLNAPFIRHDFLSPARQLGTSPNGIENFLDIISETLEIKHPMTYRYIRYAQRGEQIGPDGPIKNLNLTEWRELRRLTACFGELIISYRNISPSKEFDSVYLHEAYNYLAPVYETTRDKNLLNILVELGLRYTPELDPPFY